MFSSIISFSEKDLNQTHCFVVVVLGFWWYDNHEQKHNAYSCKICYFEIFV